MMDYWRLPGLYLNPKQPSPSYKGLKPVNNGWKSRKGTGYLWNQRPAVKRFINFHSNIIILKRRLRLLFTHGEKIPKLPYLQFKKKAVFSVMLHPFFFWVESLETNLESRFSGNLTKFYRIPVSFRNRDFFMKSGKSDGSKKQSFFDGYISS